MKQKQFNQSQKLAILKSAEKTSIKDAASVAGVHYTTVYDWKNQLESLGEAGFLEYQPRTRGRGIKRISLEKEKSILGTWQNNPEYGPGQVRNQLRRQGITISTKSVRKIMVANGYKVPGKRSRQDEDERFEATRPLELAQMDILEFFINKVKVYLILLLDDFSRFILGFRLLEEASSDEVISVVHDAMNRYGKMEEILTDRGFVFYSWRGINRFEKFLEVNGIDHTHASAHHPKTLGKVEACNKRIKQELIKQKHFLTLQEANTAVGKWVHHYNYNRTHQGIGGLLVPAERFHGQAEDVLSDLMKGIDISNENRYKRSDVHRSIISLVLNPEGHLTLHLLGHPIQLTARDNYERIDT